MNAHPNDLLHLVARSGEAGPHEPLVQETPALAWQLADVLLANVQNTASLNLTAARALLAHARIPQPAQLEQRSDTWHSSWRSFEVCTTADQVVQLTRGHVERTTAALWGATERLVAQMPQVQQQRVAELSAAFAAMRDAQAACWHAIQHIHGQLLALARSPAPPPREEATHGPY